MIGIIHVGNALKEPYFEKYEKVLTESKKEYEIIMWDRKNKEREYPANVHAFFKKTGKGKLSKALAFSSYFRFVQKIIKEKKYDKLILLTTLSAFSCKRILKKRYAGKYVFDIRDLTYEYYAPFKKNVAEIVKNSAFTTISSSKFKEFLPNWNYYVRTHNFRYEDVLNAKPKSNLKKDGIINVVYIGFTRGDVFNCRLVEIFGGDKRFSLRIAGERCDSETVLAKAKGYDNVNISGRYELNEKFDLIKSADMIINMNLNSFNGKRLVSNKYYDSLTFKLPQIARKGEFIGELVERKGLGITLDFDDESFADKVYSYMENLDEEKFYHSVRTELNEVLEEDKIFIAKLKNFIEE